MHSCAKKKPLPSAGLGEAFINNGIIHECAMSYLGT